MDHRVPPSSSQEVVDPGLGRHSDREESSEQWQEFQRLTRRSSELAMYSMRKLHELEESSALKFLPDKPYEMSPASSIHSPITARDRPLLTTSHTDYSGNDSDSSGVWRPIDEVLNEEIRQKRELMKPPRPPPLHRGSVPDRPAPPIPQRHRLPDDDQSGIGGSAVQPTKRSVSAAAPDVTSFPSWDDPQAEEFYKNVTIDLNAPATTATARTAQKQPLETKDSPAREIVATLVTEKPTKQSPNKPLMVPDSFLKELDYVKANGAPLASVESSSSLAHDASSHVVALPPNLYPPLAAVSDTPSQEPRVTATSATSSSSSLSSATVVHNERQWTSFDRFATLLPQSESGFFNRLDQNLTTSTPDPFAPQLPQAILSASNPFATIEEEEVGGGGGPAPTVHDDPFTVKQPEQLISEVQEKARQQLTALEIQQSVDFFRSSPEGAQKTTPFEDKQAEGEADAEAMGDGSLSPLYDEDETEVLEDFIIKPEVDQFDLMIRYPIKKKIVGERYWKPVFIRIKSDSILLFHSRNEKLPFHEIPLQVSYSLSEISLQQYDVYGKIHTVKLQCILYKERVGIRPGQIPKLVEGQFTKLGLPLEHTANFMQIVKFGCLTFYDMQNFVNRIEDVLFHMEAKREKPMQYRQDEIQIHCCDEYVASVNKGSIATSQKARVRLFCLAFVSGMPWIELGLNDRRRDGKEIVRRKDIMPMYTERWIRFEQCELHSSVDRQAYENEQVIRMKPLDACLFEVIRFRVRPPKAKELPLQIKATMNIAGSKIEIRIECMVTTFRSRKARQVPCEQIQIRFPIPEAWIYLFREERHWGYGSVHAKVRRPGKVKNIRDKIMGIVQNAEPSLIEVAIGDAKYEHVFKSLVWRIPRLPEKHHEAYKIHLMRCRFDLNSFDLMPEAFIPTCDVEFTMPMTTVSHTVVRSVSLAEHENPDQVEKWVRYVSKYNYKVEIDYVQISEVDVDAVVDPLLVEQPVAKSEEIAPHKTEIDTDVAKQVHTGYGIEFTDEELGQTSRAENVQDENSSSDESEQKAQFPTVEINLSGYAY